LRGGRVGCCFLETPDATRMDYDRTMARGRHRHGFCNHGLVFRDERFYPPERVERASPNGLRPAGAF
jgi:hypothetical protein